MAAVQGDALGAPAVGAAVQLGYALWGTTRRGRRSVWEQGDSVLVAVGGESHPLLPLHQLGRKVLVELLLLHMRGFDLHAVLQHVDVVGLSVHCNVTTRFKRWLFVNFLFRCRLSAMSNMGVSPGQRSKPSSNVEGFCCWVTLASFCSHTSEGRDFTHFQNVHTQIYFPIGKTSTLESSLRKRVRPGSSE